LSISNGLEQHLECVADVAEARRDRQHIDPIAVFTWDWVHTLLQSGVFTSEVEAFLHAAAPRGVTRAQIQHFLKDPEWRFPHFQRVKQRQLRRIFDERRVSSDDSEKIKCTSSELLGAYGMLRLLWDYTPTCPIVQHIPACSTSADRRFECSHFSG
jgi:hypothetical protein